jgi:ribA/ribD-fused uncharacterized protein
VITDNRPSDLQVIGAFDGPYRFLSNFYPASVYGLGDGLTYPTAEHAFQAQKTALLEVRRRIAEYVTPAAAKSAGRQVELRSDWERIKKQVMLRVVLAKFCRDADLARELCDTGHALLVEGNTWHDNYWGDCHCGRPACAAPGKNYLGSILTSARLVLREDS